LLTSSLKTSATIIILGALGCSGSSEARDDGPNSGGSGGGSTGGSSHGGSAGFGNAPSAGSTSSGGSTNPVGGSGGTSSAGSGSGGTTSAPPCTNIRPTGTMWDEATCDQWASETSECNSAWMIDNNYCNESCGRCRSGSGGTGSGGTGSGGTGNTNPTECTGTPLSGGQQHCSSTQGTLSNGVRYSVWLSNSTSGTNCGTFYGVDATFKASWNMPSDGDFLVRAGLEWNKTQTFEQLGTISADFAYTKTNVTNTKGYIGVYGWSSGPLVEYYIVEEWMGWNPASNAEFKGSFEVDGGTYDVYTHTQVNQPSIEGTQTFPQYFSIRKTARQCGHISVTEHFKKWASLGLGLGKMYEAKLLVETMSGSGTIDFTTAKVVAQ
jgi:endo-1,4-beta-xylanase